MKFISFVSTRLKTRSVRILLVVLALAGSAVLSQNCSKGFVSKDLASESLSSSSSAKACTPSANFAPTRVPLRLLSNNEYDYSVVDLFGTSSKMSSVAKFDLMVTGKSGFSNDTAAVSISDMMVEKYWNAANLLADEIITNKALANSAFSKIAACAGASTTVADSCYDSILRSLTLKVWRRPINESAANNEFTRLKAIFKAGSTFDAGLRDLVKALLISPNFLMIANNPQTADPVGGNVFSLDNFQLATRISYFLWQSTPDDQLLSLAQAGQLSQPAVIKQQVVRMLQDPRAKRLASVMSNEWLGLGDIPNLGITSIDANTLNSMITETQLLFESIIAGDLNLSTAISADYSYMNQALATFYGVPFNGSNASTFIKTDLRATPRRGVLNQAAFLIATAGSPDETHPVKRGKTVANQVACADIPPPPANVKTPVGTLPPNSTPAEVLAFHTQNPSCAGCHNILDPYGFPLETYDSKGLWRTTYPTINRSIDQSGVLPTGEAFSSTTEFMSLLASSRTVKSCLAKRVMSIGVSRATNSYNDDCVAESIGENYLNSQARFSDFVSSIITSRQFNMQTTEAP